MSTKLNAAVKKYLDLRDERDAIKQRHKEELAGITDQMKKIEFAIQKFFHKTGQKSAKTDAGTPYLQTRVTATVADPEQFFAFVRDTDGFDFLENRANKTAVQAYMEEHDEPPPGVRVTTQQVVNINRSK